MKILMILTIALSASFASAKCGSQSTAGMFDNTGFKVAVQKSDSNKAGTKSNNMEANLKRAPRKI